MIIHDIPTRTFQEVSIDSRLVVVKGCPKTQLPRESAGHRNRTRTGPECHIGNSSDRRDRWTCEGLREAYVEEVRLQVLGVYG